MLAENWTSRAAADAEALNSSTSQAAAPPAFNPAAPEYNELARRVSQSSAMRRWNELTIRAKQLEKQLPGLTGDAKEAKQQEIEETQQQLADAQAALSDLQASFEPDPLSLVPWMSALFALADAGCRSFDTGGAGWPPCPGQAPLTELLAGSYGNPAAASAWLYGGAEKVLGVFKRRYEAERGPGSVSIFTRLSVNCFGDDSAAQLAAAVEAAVERSRVALLGPEAAAAGGCLDLVQLAWLDYKECDFLPVLLALARLARDKSEPNPEGGPPVVTEPKRIAGIGLVDAPVEAVTAALRAGVPLACVTVSYNLLDVAAAPLLELCRARGITVFAAGALAHGLISEAFLGVAAPNTAAGAGSAAAGSTAGGSVAAAEALGPDNLAAAMQAVARYGGWQRFQRLLACLKSVADKHRVSLEAVALRWLIDQGTFPLTAARWSASAGPWATFGHTYGLTASAQAAATDAASQDAATSAAAAGGEEGAGEANEAEQPAEQQQQQSEVAGVAVSVQKREVPLGGGEAFVPGVDGALFQVASFLDAEDVAALGSLCGAAVQGQRAAVAGGWL
ncbi:hypothetical protein OEZ85_004755 [Tetradesmus obliquus]|uniref:NADP-dependent oxidoreductase domain-containing protein n=1 Tax=Tetradesmus obliquus TaxID=3088 RepID=A0ABY8UQ88_TETOB|nr:hypothetical protein OEZ85_004755 [Tetradesmus obliquus]